MIMMNFVLILLSLLLAGNAHAQTGFTNEIPSIDQCIWWSEEDGFPANYSCQRIKVTNGSLTDNGDGSFSLSISSGSTPEADTLDAVADRGATTNQELTTGGLIVATDQNVGLGSGKGLIEFEDEATDNINLMNANVGIGTTAPGSPFDVQGKFQVDSNGSITRITNTTSNITSAGASFTGTATVGSTNTGASASTTVKGSSSTSGILILKSTTGVGATDSIKFQVGNNGATEAARIITSGFVGIGTTAPAYQLDVANTMRAGGYRSSDSSLGLTATCTLLSITAITVKNGLITACN